MELKRKQFHEIELFKENNMKDSSYRFHTTPDIIGLKKKQENLGSIGKYGEAKKLNKKIENLEDAALIKQNKEIKGKINSKSLQLYSKHQKELQALSDRFKSQREALILQRNKELEVLEKRYVNVKNDMELKYKLEVNKLVKASPLKRMVIKERLQK